jgi:hypothetical protein
LSSASGVLAEFVDGSLTMFLGTNDNDFSQVWNWGDDSCSKFNFVVSLVDVENVVALRIFLWYEFLHVVVDLVSSEVNLKSAKNYVGSQEGQDVGLLHYELWISQKLI